MKNTTCYATGVFGGLQLYDFRDITTFILDSFGFSKAYDEDSFVTIVQRNYRLILNLEDLFSTVNLAGFPNIRIVHFENVSSVKEQVYIAATSSVMIGVHGAGLQWSMFMKPGSHLVEIAWPQKQWNFYYSKSMGSYGIETSGIVASHVQVNWTSYSRHLRKGVPLSESEKAAKLENPVIDTGDNLYKYADVEVPLDDVSIVLARIMEKLNRKR